MTKHSYFNLKCDLFLHLTKQFWCLKLSKREFIHNVKACRHTCWTRGHCLSSFVIISHEWEGWYWELTLILILILILLCGITSRQHFLGLDKMGRDTRMVPDTMLLLTPPRSYSRASCVKTAWFSSLGHSACRTISTRWKLDQSRGHLQFPKPCEQLLQQVSKNKMRDESATGWPICCLQYIPKPIFGWIIQQNSDRNLSRRAPVFFQCGNWKQKRKNPITAVQRELAGELLRWSR